MTNFLNSAQVFDDLVGRWQKIVIPFLASAKNSRTGAIVFGSGFMTTYRGKYFLVTAKHVLDDVMRHGTCAINVNGHVLLLEDLRFTIDHDNDLAFAPIEEALFRNKVERVFVIDLTPGSPVRESLGYHLLMGYPATKNKLDPRWGKVDRMLLSITAKKNEAKHLWVKNISDPVVFDYDPKKQFDSASQPAGQPPQPYGMSGGPALEVRFSWAEEVGFSLYVTLSGVLVEWHENKRAIVAASSGDLLRAFEAAEE